MTDSYETIRGAHSSHACTGNICKCNTIHDGISIYESNNVCKKCKLPILCGLNCGRVSKFL